VEPREGGDAMQNLSVERAKLVRFVTCQSRVNAYNQHVLWAKGLLKNNIYNSAVHHVV
jgi:hypothetical protein